MVACCEQRQEITQGCNSLNLQLHFKGTVGRNFVFELALGVLLLGVDNSPFYSGHKTSLRLSECFFHFFKL